VAEKQVLRSRLANDVSSRGPYRVANFLDDTEIVDSKFQVPSSRDRLLITSSRQVWVELQMHVSPTAAPGDFHFIQRTSTRC
jgi:hypothetical protein